MIDCEKPSIERYKDPQWQLAYPFTLRYTLVVIQEKSNHWVAINLFVHHESKNSHLGSSAVVQFNGTFLQFLHTRQVGKENTRTTV